MFKNAILKGKHYSVSKNEKNRIKNFISALIIINALIFKTHNRRDILITLQSGSSDIHA